MTDHNISTVNDHESYCETCEEFVPNDHLREHQLDDDYNDPDKTGIRSGKGGPFSILKLIKWLR